MHRNLSTVSTKLRRIAELAKQSSERVFTSLAYHLDLDWLCEAYRRTRKEGAPGVDGRSAWDYEKQLEENLRSLLNRAKAGSYQVPPVRRVHIPRGNSGQTRPIGIPTVEDKILQRGIAMLLEADEQCSAVHRQSRTRQRLQRHRFFRRLQEASGDG